MCVDASNFTIKHGRDGFNDRNNEMHVSLIAVILVEDEGSENEVAR